jgi:tetratricopeptide (TPR) repeat protein
MKNHLQLVLVIMLVFVKSIRGQAVILQTGEKIDAQSVRREADMVMARVQVGTGSGEVGYHLAQIAKIEFPEPRALKTASDLLGRAQPQKALAEIDPVVAYYAPFKTIVGSWWSQAALIKVSILSALQREADAEALATEIGKATTDPEAARGAQLRLMSALIRKGNFDKAIAICDAAIKESSDRATLANAWIAKGDALLAQKHADEALLAYLHVPVFYYDETVFVPAALLGSGRSYRRLDDKVNAKKAFTDLIATFPKTAEATVAQSELQKLEKQ